MVAKITFPKRAEAALNYNEKKVQQGKAVCLAANGYLREGHEINFYQKLAGLENRNRLNERAATKTLHVSLNFDPSEKLPNNKLIEIANQYMDRIGFGDQPFLVYKHEDAGHPHIHIVSTIIKHDGSRINTHNIGRNQSEKARKELEHLYGLVRAERQRKATGVSITEVNVEKAIYGKQETKRAISNIVDVVYHQYNFTSLAEYNAGLRQFNVLADQGREGGRIHNSGGLVYWLLDRKGQKVGVPIKASSLTGQPTLKALERRFLANNPAREALKQSLKDKIDTCQASSQSLKQFEEFLSKQKVFTLLRQNAEGKVYGITYVDNAAKCVFNGSDLGKSYSAAGMQSPLGAMPAEKLMKGNEPPTTGPSAGTHPGRTVQQQQKQEPSNASKESLLNLLLGTKEQYAGAPAGLQKKKRKKKKKPNPNL